ncbi:MAG: hypothetical protein K2W96_15690 [Gemmataceae bacterium]|nr:hypothetical protein [Gemmataceae bacterium]
MNATLPCLAAAALFLASSPAAAQPLRRPTPASTQAAKAKQATQLMLLAAQLQNLNNALKKQQQQKAQQQALAAAQQRARAAAPAKKPVAGPNALANLLAGKKPTAAQFGAAPKLPASSLTALLGAKPPAGFTGKQGVQTAFNAMGLWGGMTPKTNPGLAAGIKGIPDSAWAKDPGQIAVNRLVDKMLGGF